MKVKLISLAVGALCLLVLSIYAVWISLPLVLSGAVKLVPVTLEDNIGRAIVSGMARPGNVCDDPATKAFIDTVSARLTSAMPATPYRFNIQVVRNPQVNALAAPGGHILIFSGLIDRMDTPEQLAAVLAHEMQHVVQRHSMKGIVRAVGLQAFLSLVLGDVGIFGDLAGNLTVLHFMRGDEQSADDEALNTLIRAGISPEQMRLAFENLAKASPGESNAIGLKYLSTHPPLQERIERVRSRTTSTNVKLNPIVATLPKACHATP
jgi:predicted Zn-dependent protease